MILNFCRHLFAPDKFFHVFIPFLKKRTEHSFFQPGKNMKGTFRFVQDCNTHSWFLFFMRHGAPSSHIRFCLRTKIFSPVQPTVHTYPVKTVTENTSFRKRSPLKDGAVFSNYCVFEWKGKKDSKTQRVDADFVKAEKKNPRFQAKTDTCGPGLRRW